eukprot:scaffold4562_cov183-Ochromonas_danica.AAC.3
MMSEEAAGLSEIDQQQWHQQAIDWLGDLNFTCDRPTTTTTTTTTTLQVNNPLDKEEEEEEVLRHHRYHHPDADLSFHVEEEREKRKRRVRETPRVIKRDFRRQIIAMYANVDNGASQELMHRFLQEFALPSCHYLDNVQSKNGMMALAGIKPIMITGLSKVQEVFCERVVNIPDFTLHIDRSWISQSTDRPGSRLYAEVSIKGSLLSYDWFQVMDKHKTRVYHLPALVIKTLHIADQLNTVTGGSKDHVEKTNFPVGPPSLSPLYYPSAQRYMMVVVLPYDLATIAMNRQARCYS